jgi:hypothetical protein
MYTTEVFVQVMSDIQKEFEYQNSLFNGNEKKPMEIWMLLGIQYFQEALEKYTHGTQAETLVKIRKAAACCIRAIIAGPRS